MTKFPELLESYLIKKKNVDDISPIYIEVLDWLDSEKENYSLTINKLTRLCHNILSHFRSKEQIESHINYVSTDILSIIYYIGSKHINFPENCRCNVANPFENTNGYELEYEFWKLLCELSMEVALKCSPKEGYVIFIEVILGSISLPIFSDKTDSNSKTRDESTIMSEKTSPVLLSEKKNIPRFFRYLGLNYSIICISRMKRNKAQFITTVCSLILRKFVYDIECDTLYSCNCSFKNAKVLRYCTTAKMFFLQYLVDNIIKLLFDCLEESKCDAEYKNQEIGIFNSESSDGNINVTQHTIYSFLMKILENLIIVDLHDVEISFSSETNQNDVIIQNMFLSNDSISNLPYSIISIASSEILNQDTRASNNYNYIWIEIIYKLCYDISYVSPYAVIDTLNNTPICVSDIETQPGDLDVTSLSIACYSYALFAVLETRYPIAVNYIYPKSIISLTLKLNIIYRTITVFLTYSDNNKLGYEVESTTLGNHDILLSYFNVFQPNKISKKIELIGVYYALINIRLQEKAYFLLENSINDLIKCREIAPDLFSTIYGLNWHQNILIKQIMYSFTRSGSDHVFMNHLSNIINSNLSVNLYSKIFDKFTTSLNECYSYSVLFSLYFNLMEFQKKLFSNKIIHSAKVIIGILNILRGILWKDIYNQDCNRVSIQIKDIHQMMMFSSSFLTTFKNIDLDSSQSDKMILIVLNLLKLILLSFKNNKTQYFRDIVHCLVEEPSITKKYISQIELTISEIDNQDIYRYDMVKFVIQDIEKILEFESTI